MQKGLLSLMTMALLASPPRLVAAPGTPRAAASGKGARPTWVGPVALAASPDGAQLFVACAGSSEIAVVDLSSHRVVRRTPLPDTPSGLVLNRDGTRLYVSCAAARSWVCEVRVATGRIQRSFAAGHTALAPVLSPDGQRLYVCNRFDADVSCIDLRTGRALRRIRVRREPVAAALTPGGEWLLVANHLHDGRANVDVASAAISVLDTAGGQLVKEIELPNGSGLLRDLCISPDGRYACVTHVLARFHFVPRTVHLGWINQNVISLLDLRTWTVLATVGLDEWDHGAANPWGATWSADGSRLCVTHAGTHELSVIEAPALLRSLHALPERTGPVLPPHRERFTHYQMPRHGPARSRAEVIHDFHFLAGFRRRVPVQGWGPRAAALVGDQAYVAQHFSDSVVAVGLAATNPVSASIPLAEAKPQSLARRGERCFNDATLCSQGWQSCASCHDDDARADALNWDLLNDGAHNPKNTRSLLLAHRTPPVMSLQVRADAKTAVRAGLHHILFADTPPGVPEAVDAYLQSLRPIPSPRLAKGRLSASAKHGERLFCSPRTGCANCHPPPLFTDLNAYDVGSAGDYDRASDRFDTPTLLELWRTAPYLHDGSASTLREVLTTRNAGDLHGITSHLTTGEIDDLVEFLLSL
jgi:YVTN family beta-propeller protein